MTELEHSDEITHLYVVALHHCFSALVHNLKAENNLHSLPELLYVMLNLYNKFKHIDEEEDQFWQNKLLLM